MVVKTLKMYTFKELLFKTLNLNECSGNFTVLIHRYLKDNIEKVLDNNRDWNDAKKFENISTEKNNFQLDYKEFLSYLDSK